MFNWLTDYIVEFLISIIQSQSINIGELVEISSQTPSQFHPQLWDLIQKFNTYAVMPVAFTILGCFIFSEFIMMLNKHNSQGIDLFKNLIIVIIKIQIGILILQHVPEIIDSIFDIANTLLSGGNFIISQPGVDVGTISEVLEGESTLTLLLLFIEGVVIKFFSGIVVGISKMVIIMRFVEIYVYTAIAPIPLSMIISSSKEWSSMGYMLLKRMAALALQVIFIMIIFMFYKHLVELNFVTVSDSNITGAMLQNLTLSILLVICLFQCGGWSKSVFGVH